MVVRAIFLTLSLALLTADLPSRGQDSSAKPLTPEQLREEEAYTIGVQAYVYGFPVVEMYRTRYWALHDAKNKNRLIPNQFGHARNLLDHTYRGVVSPNNDTLYSSAWLDLSREPMVLELPAVKDRYFSFQLMDFFTNNFAIIDKRTTGGKAGTYTIVGPGWKGKLPDGLRIEAPTPTVWLLGRTLVEGKDDLPNVHALQDQYRLTPLSAWGKKDGGKAAASKDPLPPHDPSKPLQFFATLNAGLRENPPPAREVALMSLFARIGVGPDKTFRANALDPATAKGLERAVAVGRQMILQRARKSGTSINGWNLPPKEIGNYGDDYLLRAQVASWGLAALSPSEAVYFTCYQDDRGNPLSGKHRYLLRFNKGQLPPVEAFWSVTMYRLPELLLIENPLGRYAIGDRTKGLRYGSDGSLEIHVQHDSPGKERESNWLPAPAGEFSLNLRAYLPRPEARDGTWKIPPIKRLP